MAVDPIIAHHAVGFHRFELSCIRTRNIRDQIVRAELLVERLIARGDLGAYRDLLVIGGGAAGVSAALAACTRGIATTVLEKEHDPVCAQYGVDTRRLHPNEFDWPHTHWRQDDIGAAGSFALDYSPDTAAGLATGWRATLDDIMTGVVLLPATLEIYWGVNARTLRYRKLRHGGRIGVSPWPLAQAPTGVRPFGACISCIGFSGERTAIRSSAGGALHGPLFWKHDELGTPDLGMSTSRVRPTPSPVRALVSGSGDGAQQDVLRILTGLFGHELADALDLPIAARDLPKMAQALLAEDVALRAVGAARPKQPLPIAWRRWHVAHRRVAREIWKGWVHNGELAKRMALLKPDVQLTWLLGGAYLDYSYALNRVLALLVARLHAEATGRLPWQHAQRFAFQPLPATPPVILVGAQAHEVHPCVLGSHVCGTACYGHPHIVSAVRKVTGASHTFFIGEFDVIVPRHGVLQTPLFGSPPVHEQRVTFSRPG
jgi:hypothetical protein